MERESLGEVEQLPTGALASDDGVRRVGWLHHGASAPVAAPSLAKRRHYLGMGSTVAGGGGCCSSRSRSGSRQAQTGALAHQMFIVGCTEEGSSNAPARTAVTSGLADEFANSGEPQLGQKRCRILLPLSAILVNSLKCPEISIATLGTSKFTRPLADRCWQSRHQQTRVARGSAERWKRTAPQRQCPVLSAMRTPPLVPSPRFRPHWSTLRYFEYSRPAK